MGTIVGKHKYDLITQASKLSLIELNELIDKCVDEKNFDDARIFAEIYNRRVKI